MKKLKHDQIPRYSRDELEKLSSHPVVCLLENVRSAENVVSIFRSADAFGIDRLILHGITATPEIKNLHRSALGSQDVVDWVKVDDAAAYLSELKEEAYTLIAIEICDVAKGLDDLVLSDFPMCLIVGNEIDGVSDQLLDLCDFALEIPQFGFKQSLNVAVATGIVMQGAVAMYRKLGGKAVIPDPRAGS